MPRRIRDAVREGQIIERFHWDLNTLDDAPEWWLQVQHARWSVEGALRDEAQKRAESQAASKSKRPRR